MANTYTLTESDRAWCFVRTPYTAEVYEQALVYFNGNRDEAADMTHACVVGGRTTEDMLAFFEARAKAPASPTHPPINWGLEVVIWLLCIFGSAVLVLALYYKVLFRPHP